MFNRRTARSKLSAIADALGIVGTRLADPQYQALGDVLRGGLAKAFALDAEEGRRVVVALDLYNVLTGVYDQAVAELFLECEKAYFKTYGQKWAHD
jgi:hypothetical protein